MKRIISIIITILFSALFVLTFYGCDKEESIPYSKFAEKGIESAKTFVSQHNDYENFGDLTIDYHTETKEIDKEEADKTGENGEPIYYDLSFSRIRDLTLSFKEIDGVLAVKLEIEETVIQQYLQEDEDTYVYETDRKAKMVFEAGKKGSEFVIRESMVIEETEFDFEQRKPAPAKTTTMENYTKFADEESYATAIDEIISDFYDQVVSGVVGLAFNPETMMVSKAYKNGGTYSLVGGYSSFKITEEEQEENAIGFAFDFNSKGIKSASLQTKGSYDGYSYDQTSEIDFSYSSDITAISGELKGEEKESADWSFNSDYIFYFGFGE